MNTMLQLNEMLQKVLFLITKSNWGANENCFSFAPVRSEAEEKPLSHGVRQVLGGPTQFDFGTHI